MSLSLAACVLLAVGSVCARVDPAQALADLVDLPTPSERKAEARRLADLDEVSIEAWLEAMRGFGTFEPLEAGPLVETAPLFVDGEIVDTEIELYVPPSYDPTRPAPLMLVLHGSGGSGRGEHRPWKEVADELGMLVLCAAETGQGYAFSAGERETSLAALRWARRRANVDENRINVCGISRGGHQAWDLALRHPDRFAGLFPFIGGPRLSNVNAQNNLRYVENVAHMVIRDLQGAKDDPGLLFNLRLAFDRLEKLGADKARLIEFPELGHDFRMEKVDWRAVLSGAVRNPAPERVVRCAASLDEVRAYWIEVTRLGKGIDEVFSLRVNAATWNALDADGQKREMQKQVDAHTARLEVEMTSPGRFEAKAEGVTGFRLLLASEQFEADEQLEVRFRGKKTKKRPRPSKRLLLTEFAERFDRTFLPVVEVEVGK